ncbi:IS200/IS605 family transposase [Flagellimonas marinaquae]|uniref:IS200/IS605 family transposase n=1 Tax=Flagellimonas marinaquae TaxID=254955 RepID=UPI000F8F754C|nr:IS200/IS605 family transposase [Allomuricauda aquimarina]
MANTYTQILVQIVFAVKGRQNLITEKHREQVEKYICGIVNNKKSKALAIYCNPDHCHILMGLHPSVSISEMARDIKANSSKWINENKWVMGKFAWQEGYGAFTYSRSQLNKVVQYIRNQPEHHKKKTFKEEYIDFLEKFDIQYDDKYMFEFND